MRTIIFLSAIMLAKTIDNESFLNIHNSLIGNIFLIIIILTSMFADYADFHKKHIK